MSREKTKLYRQRASRKLNYGLSQADFETMLHLQDFRCAICGKELDDSAHVDHNHETNEIRGLLCRTCNLGIAYFKEDQSLLAKAIEYLKEWS